MLYKASIRRSFLINQKYNKKGVLMLYPTIMVLQRLGLKSITNSLPSQTPSQQLRGEVSP
jgi:hypothetical protein